MTTAGVRDERNAAELLDRAAMALRGQFPDLDRDSLEAFEVDSDCPEVRWAEGRAWFPRDEAAAGRLAVLEGLLRHLRGFLSAQIPLPRRAADGGMFGQGWFVSPPVEGRPLRPEIINDKNADRLIGDAARFLMELHGFSIERARSLGAPPPAEWRARLEQVRAAGLAAGRGRLRITEAGRARRWWDRMLADERRWQPALVHGWIGPERLLADPLGRELAAVAGWERARIGDPAWDLSAVVEAYGSEFGWRVMTRYGELGGAADADLFRRVRELGLARRFEALAACSARGDQEGAEAAVAALRSSQLLSG